MLLERCRFAFEVTAWRQNLQGLVESVVTRLHRRLWLIKRKSCCCSATVVSDSLQPHGLQPARLLCPWGSPGRNTGVGCHALLQGIVLTQGSNPSLLHWQADSLPSESPGKPVRSKARFKRCFSAPRHFSFTLEIESERNFKYSTFWSPSDTSLHKETNRR